MGTSWFNCSTGSLYRGRTVVFIPVLFMSVRERHKERGVGETKRRREKGKQTRKIKGTRKKGDWRRSR